MSSIKNGKKVRQNKTKNNIRDRIVTKTSKNIKSIIYKVISLTLIIICLISLGLFSYNLIKLNLIPLKYLIMGYVFIVLLLILTVYIVLKQKNIILRIMFLLVLTISSIGLFYANSFLSSTNNFLAKAENNVGNLSYSVIVLKDSNYNSLEDLYYKNIGFLNDEKIKDVRNNLVFSFKETVSKNFTDLSNDLLNKKEDAIVLEQGYYTLAVEEITGFRENTKVIYTFEIKTKEDVPSVDETIITKEPFILYISGIDQYGKVASIRGRSDVNQILVVNPKTHHILIVNTPRDYYVQLHGTTGLKDKLTHAGIYGIDKSITTLEDLYDIDINYYLRVNFNTLVKIVDLIGGVDIESDISFNSFHIQGFRINKGMNHFDGKQALAYARERYAYTTGDNHRGQNQQQVITAIIDKLTTTDALIKNYNSILKALSGTFQTNLSTKDITSLIRYQLDEMPKWTIESTAVTGRGSSNYTYSMGTKYLLYVMEPNIASVNVAKNKIEEVLNEN